MSSLNWGGGGGVGEGRGKLDAFCFATVKLT